MYGTYTRLRIMTFDSNIAVIRAAKTKLKPEFWYDRKCRADRHKFYRQMLDYHAKAQRLYKAAMCLGVD